jgi:hypothetical protein
MRQMRTKLLTTTALAMGLLLPTAIVAQQSTEPAPSVQDQTTAPTGEQSTTGANQSMGSQDLGQALTKLEIAQKRFEQAEGDSQSADLEQARTDALDAINEIEQALQENSDQADDTKVSDARQAIDGAREALEQEDRQPQQVAQAIGKLHDSVTGLQPMDQQQSSVDQPATSSQGADQASRDPNVEQTGEAEVTARKNDLPVNDADRAASAEDTPAPADDTTAQAPESSTAETSDGTAPTPETDTAQTSESTAPTPESDAAQTSEGTAPTPPDTALTTEPQQTAPGAETPQNQVAAMGNSLVGMELHGSDDSSIGDIEEVVAGPDGQVSSVLIDVGGFLGIGSKRVAIDVNSLEMRGDRLVVIDMTEDQVKELPEYTQ